MTNQNSQWKRAKPFRTRSENVQHVQSAGNRFAVVIGWDATQRLHLDWWKHTPCFWPQPGTLHWHFLLVKCISNIYIYFTQLWTGLERSKLINWWTGWLIDWQIKNVFPEYEYVKEDIWSFLKKDNHLFERRVGYFITEECSTLIQVSAYVLTYPHGFWLLFWSNYCTESCRLWVQSQLYSASQWHLTWKCKQNSWNVFFLSVYPPQFILSQISQFVSCF